MNNEHTFLTYSIVKDNNINKDILLDAKGLSSYDVQNAINLYTSEFGESQIEVRRLGNLVSELLNENEKLKKWKYWYDERYNAD